MKCPNCERLVSTFARRCRVCHQRLPLWYICTTVLILAVLAGVVLLFFDSNSGP